MGKPSIFSREYEKKMKKRRRNILIISLAIVLVISVLIIKVVCNPIDYRNIKGNIQAWIDSDTTNISEQTEKTKEEITNKEETVDEKSIKEDPVLKHKKITIINEAQKKNKDDKISTIIPFMNKGQIIFCEEDTEFTDQIQEFRGQKFSLHDDAADVTSEFANRIGDIKSTGQFKMTWA